MGLETIDPHSLKEHTEIYKIPKFGVNRSNSKQDTAIWKCQNLCHTFLCKFTDSYLVLPGMKSGNATHSRPQRPRSFWSALKITTSGLSGQISGQVQLVQLQSRSQSFVPLDQRSENESSGSIHYSAHALSQV